MAGLGFDLRNYSAAFKLTHYNDGPFAPLIGGAYVSLEAQPRSAITKVGLLNTSCRLRIRAA